jgi:uncharacterized protein involved in exopolysaccharide biosynthesis
VPKDPSDDKALPQGGEHAEIEQLRAQLSSLEAELSSRMLELETRSLEVHHLKMDLAVKEQFIESLEAELQTGVREKGGVRFLRRAIWRLQSLRPTPPNEPPTKDSGAL